MNIVDRAKALAIGAHSGQVNKFNGEPYILHPERVANAIYHEGGTEIQVAIAWLHDVIEDTVNDFGWLRNSLLNHSDAESWKVTNVVEGVRLLTKVPGVTNEVYYYRLVRHDDARKVKLFDILDNLSRVHAIGDAADRKRLVDKYVLGLRILAR